VALGMKAVRDWLEAVKLTINNDRARLGLTPFSFSAREDGDHVVIYAALGTRKSVCGVADLQYGVVVERQNGPIGDPRWSVITPDTAGSITA
jgi:hypothetical protein